MKMNFEKCLSFKLIQMDPKIVNFETKISNGD